MPLGFFPRDSNGLFGLRRLRLSGEGLHASLARDTVSLARDIGQARNKKAAE
jgi:hypothetical protein